MEIDPDWAMFNFAAFTGAWYGRDFLDCKTPAIHLYYWLIAKVVGADIVRIRFVHHLLVSLPGVIAGGWAGLAYIVLVQSGHMIAFHGNVGQIPAGLLLLALWIPQPWVSVALIGLALAFEPKLIPAAALLFLSSQRLPAGLLLLAATGMAALAVRFLRPQWWAWLWEANVTIPQRMVAMRKEIVRTGRQHIYPAYTARAFMYVGPLAVLAVWNRPDVLYWLPACAYLAFILIGVVVRHNHMLPLIPWLALALPPAGVVALVVMDWLGGGLYLGDLWQRFYNGLREWNISARKVGEYLRDKPGRVWVDSLHSAIYVHARKPPLFGLAEQIEICQNAPERRAVWRAQFKQNPPEWVVMGPEPGWMFSGEGYALEAETGDGLFRIYRRL